MHNVYLLRKLSLHRKLSIWTLKDDMKRRALRCPRFLFVGMRVEWPAVAWKTVEIHGQWEWSQMVERHSRLCKSTLITALKDKAVYKITQHSLWMMCLGIRSQCTAGPSELHDRLRDWTAEHISTALMPAAAALQAIKVKPGFIAQRSTKTRKFTYDDDSTTKS